MEETVGKGWKTATYVLGAAVVAQFFWWDQKCPQVLRGKGYSGMQGLRGVGREVARLKTRAEADKEAAAFRKSYGGNLKVTVEPVASRSRPGQKSYAVVVAEAKRGR